MNIYTLTDQMTRVACAIVLDTWNAWFDFWSLK